MKMYPTALKRSLSTFLGRLLILAVLFLKDTEFLKDAETDRGWSLKQCLCARSPESQVQGGPALPPSLCITCWQRGVLGENVTHTEYEVHRE